MGWYPEAMLHLFSPHHLSAVGTVLLAHLGERELGVRETINQLCF